MLSIMLSSIAIILLKLLQTTIQTERGDSNNLEQDYMIGTKRQARRLTYKSLQRRSKPLVSIPSAFLSFVSMLEKKQHRFSLQSKSGKRALMF